MTPNVAVITFPGSNGDHDAFHALSVDLEYRTTMVDYRETSLQGFDAVVLPGGFSYGDALRCGAIARFSPIMNALHAYAEQGGLIIGFCNGFQVLCESHLLPGALLRNNTLQFHSFWVHIRIEHTSSPWTENLEPGDVLKLPVAHGEGSYFIDAAGLAELEANGQIIARYCDEHGEVTEAANRNGSVQGIAAISNKAGNVVGIMPHPERATNNLVGGEDGRLLLNHIAERRLASI